MTEPPGDRIPETPDEQDALIAAKPPGWEYDLFASTLVIGEQGLEIKRLDHEFRRGAGQRQHLDIGNAGDHLSRWFSDLGSAVEQLTRMLTPEAQMRAFGPPGEAGDPVFILHLGSRLIDDYEALLDAAARLRNQSVPDEYQRAFDLAAQMVDLPLSQLHEFVIQTAAAADRVRAHIADPNPEQEKLTVRIELTLSVDEELQRQFSEEIARLTRELS
jgi:hypothetical protein